MVAFSLPYLLLQPSLLSLVLCRSNDIILLAALGLYLTLLYFHDLMTVVRVSKYYTLYLVVVSSSGIAMYLETRLNLNLISVLRVQSDGDATSKKFRLIQLG